MVALQSRVLLVRRCRIRLVGVGRGMHLQRPLISSSRKTSCGLHLGRTPYGHGIQPDGAIGGISVDGISEVDVGPEGVKSRDGTELGAKSGADESADGYPLGEKIDGRSLIGALKGASSDGE